MLTPLREWLGRVPSAPHDPTAPPLELHQVSVAYAAGHGNATRRIAPDQEQSHLYAVQDISFSLRLGERVALVGPNGAGKSTLFKLIVGLVTPSQGEIRVFGRPPENHTCIAYVPQRSEINWGFPASVSDVVLMGRVGRIGFGRWPGQADRQIVHESLARVRAEHLAGKQIAELSGGQQQRVFIARALAQRTELLLLDEPLNGLDTPSQETIFTILDSLRADGVTVMMATHNLDLAEERFDRIMLLNHRLVALAVPQECLTAVNIRLAYGASDHV
jgi:manganese/iron transport system ATP-binding protein